MFIELDESTNDVLLNMQTFIVQEFFHMLLTWLHTINSYKIELNLIIYLRNASPSATFQLYYLLVVRLMENIEQNSMNI